MPGLFSPQIVFGTTSAVTGGLVPVSGTSFPAWSPVTVYVGVAQRGSVWTDKTGAFTTAATIPFESAPGPTPVVVTDPYTRLTASAPVTVRTDWAQEGFQASHAGVNGSEVLLNARNAGAIGRKWQSPWHSSESSGALVGNGLVYVLDDTQLSALRTSTGAVAWQKTLPMTSFGRQAMVLGEGSLFVASNTGQISALDPATGTTVWTKNLALGTYVTAVGITYDDDNPGVDGARRLVVTANANTGVLTTKGTVSTLDAADGRLVWTFTAATSVSGVAVHADRVFFGTSAGNAVALFLRDGAVAWKTVTPGRTLTQPAVSNGSVVFGASWSSDGAGPTGPVGAFAFNESRGTLLWSYNAGYGQGIASRPAIAGGTVVVGLATTEYKEGANNITALDLTAGTVIWATHYEGVAAGYGYWTNPAVANGMVFIGSCGPNQKFLVLSIADGSTLRDYYPFRCGRGTPVNARVYITGKDETQALGLPVELSRVASLNDSATGTAPDALSYSTGWSVGRNAAEYNGDDHYGSTTGATATIRFSGSGFRYWFSMAPHHGIASVRIDGGAPITIDQYSSTRVDGLTSWTSPLLSRGSHQATITVSGGRNGAATGSVVTIDRIDIGR